jgi:replicative DNA helicase
MAVAFENVPPQSLESEQAVLGAMLLDPEAITLCAEKLRPESFYRESHRRIFQTILDLNARSEPVDLLTVSEALKNRAQLDFVGGAAALSALTDGVPSASNVEVYAEIVRKKALLRRLMDTATGIIQDCQKNPEEAEQVLDRAENSVLELGQTGGKAEIKSIGELMGRTIQKVDQLRNRDSHVTGLYTGFEKLDEMMAGLQRGELVIVAARPGMGKTALCLNLARNARNPEDKKKTPVAIFSLEMTAESLLHRLLCAEGSINGHNMRSGRLRSDEMSRLTLAATKLYEVPIYVDDSSLLDIQTLRARARRLVKEKGIGLLMVDYLQMMTASQTRENRQQEISTISRQLKGLAKELNIPVVVASQLSRATEQRGTKDEGGDRPRLSDLRESGAIEQDADVVVFIYRKAYYKRKEAGDFEPITDEDRTAEIIIAKQRSGPTGTVELVFQNQFTRFDSLDKRFGGPQP